MFKFSQWWKRSVRGGWAVAQGYAMHGAPPEKYMVKEHFSGWLWGAIIPLLSLVPAWFSHGWSLLLLLSYPMMVGKIYRYHLLCGDLHNHALIYAFWCMLSKIPQLIGQNQYWLTHLFRKQATIIECY